LEKDEQNIEEKKYRRFSWFVLAGLSIVMLFLAYSSTKLQFDYDFEKFFPQEDDGLEFYKNYRETFENDNDFIIIGVVNEEGIFDKDFLYQLQSFTEELRTLPHLREVISPLEIAYIELNPMGLGMKEKPFFHPDEPKLYRSDSIRMANTKEPIAEMVSFSTNALIIVVKNIQLISKEKSDELAVALQEIVDRQSFDGINMIGKIIGQKTYIEIMKEEFITFMGISIFILIIFLLITYRSLWGVAIPLATVMLAVIGSLGFMQLSGTSLNMMTTLLPVIMLVVGMSDVVHLVSKYLEEVRYKRTKVVAIKNMLKKVGVATLLTSITTALGFITMIGIDMEPVRVFGTFTAIGVLLAFALSILFIPSIFMLLKKPVITQANRIQNGWERGLGIIFLKLSRNRAKVLWTYAVITGVALFGASKIHFNYFLMQDLGEDQPLMGELRFFQEQFGGIRPFELAVMPKGDLTITDFEVMREIEKLESYLDTIYEVNQMVGPSLPFKYINKTLRNGKERFYKLPNNEKRFNFLKRQLEVFDEKEEWRQIISKDKKLGRIFGRLIDPGSSEIETRNAALEDYFQQHINNDVLGYKLTGTTVIVDQSSRYVTKNIILGLLVAFGIIAISMGILFRSIKMALLSLIPNMFPILLTAGFIGFMGIDLNMMTAIVFTIAFGIAVDDTIHFLSRYKQEMKLGRSRLFGLRRTFISTGKAIIVTTIILLGGFGSLLFSDFLSTFYIGLFVSMTLIFAVITDLTLLPMLLLRKEREET